MLDRIVRGLEKRAAPQQAYGAPGYGLGFSGSPIFGGRTDAGRNITPDNAIEAIAVYGAISLIASAIGGMPLKVYRDADERQEARTSRQWGLLHDEPNDEMAADEFWEIIAASLLGWGNAFVFKERDSLGVVKALWPIRPSRVQVGREFVMVDGVPKSVRYFIISGIDGPVYETDILHIRGLSFDGQVGYSPVQLARQEIANALEMDTFRGSFWRNGMFASGMLTHPNRLSKDAQDRLAQQIAAKSGTSRAGELLVLEEGMLFNNLTMPLEDAQFVEQAKMSDLRIAQLFGLVPPHMWGQGENSRSVTYQNSEFGGQEFIKWTARKWLIRIEQSVGRDRGIFPAPGPTLFPEFDVNALLRSDMKTRWETYAVGLTGGFIDPEWVQEQEHILIPRTITPPAQAAAAALAPAPDSEPDPGDTGRQRRSEMFLPQIRMEMPEMKPPDVHVHVPEQQRPTVLVRQDAPTVNVDMNPVAAAIGDAVAALSGLADRVGALELPAPNVTVNVPQQPAPVVNVTLADEPEQMQIDFQYGANGKLKSATVTDG